MKRNLQGERVLLNLNPLLQAMSAELPASPPMPPDTGFSGLIQAQMKGVELEAPAVLEVDGLPVEGLNPDVDSGADADGLSVDLPGIDSVQAPLLQTELAVPVVAEALRLPLPGQDVAGESGTELPPVAATTVLLRTQELGEAVADLLRSPVLRPALAAAQPPAESVGDDSVLPMSALLERVADGLRTIASPAAAEPLAASAQPVAQRVLQAIERWQTAMSPATAFPVASVTTDAPDVVAGTLPTVETSPPAALSSATAAAVGLSPVVSEAVAAVVTTASSRIDVSAQRVAAQVDAESMNQAAIVAASTARQVTDAAEAAAVLPVELTALRRLVDAALGRLPADASTAMEAVRTGTSPDDTLDAGLMVSDLDNALDALLDEGFQLRDAGLQGMSDSATQPGRELPGRVAGVETRQAEPNVALPPGLPARAADNTAPGAQVSGQAEVWLRQADELPEHILQHVGRLHAQALRLHGAGYVDVMQRLTLTLYPEDLGQVDVRMHSADQLNLSFVAREGATRDLIEQNLGRLRQMFEANGISLGSVDVGSGQTAHQDQSQRELANAFRLGRGAVGPVPALAAAGAANPVMRADRLVDIRA
ncbi:MAG: flagellar hook-length control protein FliK [Pseudomonadales bacterium]|nr:flagellar hook-length control protein FliK [Pseudomonadales bacterium]MCP5184754.1 flagellar hook-length control protein FliK [Pseudomonadales bacterium]